MVIGLIIVVFLAVLFVTRAPYLGIAAVMTGIILASTFAYAIWLTQRGTWECRVEGTVLSLHRPRDRGWVVMQISDIDQITDLRPGNSEGRTDLELLLLDGSRVLLDRRLVGNQKRFNWALRQSNPRIRFTQRDWRECYFCGGQVQGLRERCQNCDAPVAVPIPPEQ